jgi:hypothetical protein
MPPISGALSSGDCAAGIVSDVWLASIVVVVGTLVDDVVAIVVVATVDAVDVDVERAFELSAELETNDDIGWLVAVVVVVVVIGVDIDVAIVVVIGKVVVCIEHSRDAHVQLGGLAEQSCKDR